MGIPRRYQSRLLVRGGKLKPTLTASAPPTTAGSGGTGGYYEPLTTGIVATPELIFAAGDVIMVWRELPDESA